MTETDEQPTQTKSRQVHLVGSIPETATDLAMRWALIEFGDRLTTVPDGEVGPRRSWIVSQFDRFGSNPNLELVKAGDWSGYDQVPRYKVKRQHKLSSESLDLRYAYHALMARYELDELLSIAGLSERRLLVGIPSPFDLRTFALGMVQGFKNRYSFRLATAQEVTTIHDKLRERVVYQLELPLETIFAITAQSLPGPARRMICRQIAKSVRSFIDLTPEGTNWYVHLCLGDLNRRPVNRPNTSRPLAELALAIYESWPRAHTLEAIHLPLCDGSTPPSTKPEDLYDLAALQDLPIQVIAGIAHLRAPIEDQLKTLNLVERFTHHRVAIAAHCGMGRMNMDEANRLAKRHRELADS